MRRLCTIFLFPWNLVIVLEAFESITTTRQYPSRRLSPQQLIPFSSLSSSFRDDRTSKEQQKKRSSSTTTTTSLKMIFGRGDKNNNSNRNNNDPDVLLKMVEELTMAVDDVTPELMNKMEKVEIALASFLEEKSSSILLLQQDRDAKPPPPSIPPPMGALYNNNNDNDMLLSSDLMKAEQALEKLRQRLRREEEALFEAEQVLQRSIEEQDILRQAEEALQKSRDAAEKRRTSDTTRRNGRRAVGSGETRQQQQQTTTTTQQETTQPPQRSSVPRLSSKRPRPTIELGGFFGRKASSSRRTSAAAPAGMSVLYNWSQEEDGSLRGNVKESPNFADGATISTSPVQRGAQEGTVVTTASGSQYFLEAPSLELASSQGGGRDQSSAAALSSEKRATQPLWFQSRQSSSKSSESDHSKAPEGVPSIRNWKVSEDGGVSGLIYGSMNAQDGDCIETSTIAKGELDNGNVVETSSGSRYFLSPESADNISTNILNAFKSLSGRDDRSGKGTITINNSPTSSGARDRKTPEAAMNALEEATPRSTFSLFDLFGPKEDIQRPQDAPPPLPPLDVPAPKGVPTLTGWNVNEDGSLTGYVYGSTKLGDGNLVTTSPIAKGQRTQFQVVTTVSGSLYWLA